MPGRGGFDGPPEGRTIAVFAAVCGAAVGVSAGVLVLLFRGPTGRRAVAASAVIALAVQIVTYAVARRGVRRPGRPIITAWVVGMMLRFGVLGVYGLVALRSWDLAPVPALLSLVVFFFLSTLLEPWLLQS
jgi:hypothetical protein